MVLSTFLILLILISLTYATFEGYDLVYKRSNSEFPRALLADEDGRPIRRLFGSKFSICLYTFLESNNSSLKTVNLFSYSSSDTNEVNEIVLNVDYAAAHTDFYIHGQKLSFDVTPHLDEWTHLCISWERYTGESNLYLNGDVAGSGKVQKGYRFASIGLFVLGQLQKDTYNSEFHKEDSFYGKMTQFNIWDIVLAQVEVKQVQKCSKEGNAVSWSNSTWILYDDIVMDPTENPCRRVDTPEKCMCNNFTLEAFRDIIVNFKTEMQSQLNNSNQGQIDLKKSYATIKENVTSLQLAVNEVEGDVTTLKQGVATCENEINSLKAAHASDSFDDKKELKELATQTTAFAVELNFLNNTVFAYESEVVEMNYKIFTHEQEIRELKKRNCSCDQGNTIMPQPTLDYGIEIRNLQQKNAGLETEMSSLKQRNTAAENEVNGLKRRADQTEKKLADLQQNLQNEMKAVRDFAENEIKKLKDAISANTKPSKGNDGKVPYGPEVVRMT